MLLECWIGGLHHGAVKNTVFWVVIPCSSGRGGRHFFGVEEEAKGEICKKQGANRANHV